MYVNLKPDTWSASRRAGNSSATTRIRSTTRATRTSCSADGEAADTPVLDGRGRAASRHRCVDYRSSAPQGLFNGHLTAANSDVRVGDNSKRHGSRWGGLIAWWQGAFGQLGESEPQQRDLLELDRPDAPATPLPPDRPAGAAPERIEDAAQEFLTDWLVRRQYQQALDMLSPRAYACVNLTDDARGVALDTAAARRELLKLMEYANHKLGSRTSLSSAMIAVTQSDPKRPIVDHAFRRSSADATTETEARAHLRPERAGDGAGISGVVFQFRIAGGGGRSVAREGGRKIVPTSLDPVGRNPGHLSKSRDSNCTPRSAATAHPARLSREPLLLPQPWISSPLFPDPGRGRLAGQDKEVLQIVIPTGE